MIILTLETKKCMSELLLRDSFDDFSFIEGEITTFNKFSIDGYLHKEFYEEAPDKDYSDWKDLREYCFSLIKGRRTPLDFKLIYSLSGPGIDAFLTREALDFESRSIQGLYLNFRYDGSHLTCTTGTSLSVFTLDKSLEQAWDREAQRFLADKNIPYEINL